MKPLFNDANGIYNYCPSIIEKDGVWHIFYCSNLIPFRIIDYIAYRQVKPVGSNYQVIGEKTYILEPSSDNLQGWDHVHACDPSMVEGTFFVNGKTYTYALAYLGCNTLDCTYNEVGLAFSHDLIGPWVKYPLNPIVPYAKNEPRAWGVGQPSLINLNKQSLLRLFYTRGTNENHNYYIDFDFSERGQGHANTPRLVPDGGLEIMGKKETFNNVDFMFDGSTYYAIRDTRYRDGKFPSIITPIVQILKLNAREFEKGNGTWTILDHIEPEITGFPRNHNAAFVRDKFGWLPSGPIRAVFTSSPLANSNEDLIYLWNYRLHPYIVKGKDGK